MPVKRRWRSIASSGPDTEKAEAQHTLVKRAQQTQLFQLNVSGQRRSQRWCKKVRPFLEYNQPSKYTSRAVDKIRRALRQNGVASTKASDDAKESLPPQIDVWAEISAKPISAKASNYVPAQHESIWPSQNQLKDILGKEVQASWDGESKAARKEALLLQPMTTLLRDAIPDVKLLDTLTSLQKQRVLAFVKELRRRIEKQGTYLTVDRLQEITQRFCAYLREDCTVQGPERRIYEEEGVLDEDIGNIPVNAYGLDLLKRPKDKKTQQQRRRQKQHQELLRHYAELKESKLLQKEFSHIPQFTAESVSTSPPAKKSSTPPPPKKIDEPPSLLLPSDYINAQGSLRKLKISTLTNATMKQQVNALYTHQFKRMKSLLTNSSIARYHKLMRKRFFSRKLIVKV